MSDNRIDAIVGALTPHSNNRGDFPESLTDWQVIQTVTGILQNAGISHAFDTGVIRPGNHEHRSYAVVWLPNNVILIAFLKEHDDGSSFPCISLLRGIF